MQPDVSVAAASESDFTTWLEQCLLHRESGAQGSTGPKHVGISRRQRGLLLPAPGQLGRLRVSLLPNADLQLIAMHAVQSAIGWIWRSQGTQNEYFKGPSPLVHPAHLLSTEECIYSTCRIGRVL